MLRHAVCAAAVLAFAVGASARADEFVGSIRKIEDGKIVVGVKFDKETKKFAEMKTLTVAKDVKVVTGKYNKEEKKFEVGKVLEGGLENKRFQNIGERGVRAFIITNADNQVTEIRVLGGRKKKPAD